MKRLNVFHLENQVDSLLLFSIFRSHRDSVLKPSRQKISIYELCDGRWWDFYRNPLPVPSWCSFNLSFFDWIASPSGANICSQVPLIKKAVEKKNAKGKVEDLFYRWPRGHCHAPLPRINCPNDFQLFNFYFFWVITRFCCFCRFCGSFVSLQNCAPQETKWPAIFSLFSFAFSRLPPNLFNLPLSCVFGLCWRSLNDF